MSKENDARAISSFSEDDAARPKIESVALRKYARTRARRFHARVAGEGVGEGR
jgi:hypothetical protein